ARTLAHAAVVIAGFHDPLTVLGTAGDHAHMVRPDNNGADAGTVQGTAAIGPVPREIVLRPATELGPHPPAAPARRLRPDAIAPGRGPRGSGGPAGPRRLALVCRR